MFARILGLALLAAVVAAIVAHRSDSAGPDVVYVVKRYDTVWAIAAAHYGGDVRDAVSRIRKRNRLDGALIRPGQKLVLPR
jgi:nucleoid-associated protein YgaU